jgi:hypothetical protein
MHRLTRAAIRVAFWAAVLAAVASAADLGQFEPVPDRERPLRPGEVRGPSIQDVIDAFREAGDINPPDSISDPGPSTGRWRVRAESPGVFLRGADRSASNPHAD